MSDVSEFARLTDELRKKKNYKKEELAPVHSILARLTIDEAAARGVCEGLSKLQWQDSVDLLSRKWPDIPAQSRYVFLQWRWDGKDKEAVIPACLAMAAAIYPADAESASSFLGGAVNLARFPATGKVHLSKGLRRTWVEPKDDDGRPRFARLTWDQMEPAWRWDLVEGLVEAAMLKPTDGKQKGAQTDARPLVAEWIETLLNGRGDGDAEAKRLIGLKQRLARQSAPSQPPREPDLPDAPERQVPSAVTSGGEAGPMLNPTVRLLGASAVAAAEDGPGAKATSPEQRQATGNEKTLGAAAAFSRSLDAMVQEGRRYAEVVQRQVTALERRVEDANSTRSALEADLSQLRRDVQAERAKGEQFKADATRYREDLEAAQRQINELESQLMEARDSFKAETQKLGELQGNVAEANRKHVEILDSERQEARRLLGQKIAQAIAPDVQHFREVEQEPPSADQAKFLRSLMTGMIKRLQAVDVPIEG